MPHYLDLHTRCVHTTLQLKCVYHTTKDSSNKRITLWLVVMQYLDGLGRGWSHGWGGRLAVGQCRGGMTPETEKQLQSSQTSSLACRIIDCSQLRNLIFGLVKVQKGKGKSRSLIFAYSTKIVDSQLRISRIYTLNMSIFKRNFTQSLMNCLPHATAQDCVTKSL